MEGLLNKRKLGNAIRLAIANAPVAPDEIIIMFPAEHSKGRLEIVEKSFLISKLEDAKSFAYNRIEACKFNLSKRVSSDTKLKFLHTHKPNLSLVRLSYPEGGINSPLGFISSKGCMSVYKLNIMDLTEEFYQDSKEYKELKKAKSKQSE